MEYFKITAETFGNPEQYKSLPYIASYVDTLDRVTKRKVTGFINKLNHLAKSLNSLTDYDFFIRELVRNEYRRKIDEFCEHLNLEEKFRTHLHNYINAKIMGERRVYPIDNSEKVYTL